MKHRYCSTKKSDSHSKTSEHDTSKRKHNRSISPSKSKEHEYSKKRHSSPKSNSRKRSPSRSTNKDDQTVKYVKLTPYSKNSKTMTGDEIRKIAMNVYKDIAKETKEKSFLAAVQKPAELYSNPILLSMNDLNQRNGNSRFNPISYNQHTFSKYRVKYSDDILSGHSDYLNTFFNGIFPISKGEVHKISETDSDPLQISAFEYTPPETNPYFFDYSNLTEQNQSFNSAGVISNFASRLMKQMGWNEGEGLGKTKAGTKSALTFDIKRDRKGLASIQEKYDAIQAHKNAPKISVEKNPVSALMEFCQKRKITLPEYNVIHSSGPPNMPAFKISVTLMNRTFVTPESYTTKKEAKNKTASLAVKTLNIL